eukprot:CAMPEP_0119160358 /NCGR_PEP_ID=MMETSP1315-20130426/326_1 /TAXON_ID=676789 /ORGANISM="Prasinoderma singularis, Strain RCC927" /LENGTH=62 /DNA_ID=CAMNT_0007153011 /DNA_START=29 /DNA_END=217 /DNA_ORIENTATION=+
MSGRQGGKLKPLKQKKKKGPDFDDEELEARKQRQADAKALKDAKAALAGGAKLGAGLKKSKK